MERQRSTILYLQSRTSISIFDIPIYQQHCSYVNENNNNNDNLNSNVSSSNINNDMPTTIHKQQVNVKTLNKSKSNSTINPLLFDLKNKVIRLASNNGSSISNRQRI